MVELFDGKVIPFFQIIIGEQTDAVCE